MPVCIKRKKNRFKYAYSKKKEKRKTLNGLKRPEHEGIIIIFLNSDWIINVRLILRI